MGGGGGVVVDGVVVVGMVDGLSASYAGSQPVRSITFELQVEIFASRAWVSVPGVAGESTAVEADDCRRLAR